RRHLLGAHPGYLRRHGAGQDSCAEGIRRPPGRQRRLRLPDEHQRVDGNTARSTSRPTSGVRPLATHGSSPKDAPQRSPAIELDFKGRAHNALGDDQLRRNFRTAMDSLMTKRAASFSDADERERLREMGNHIRARALSKLPELLERLEANLTRNGVK